MASRLLRKEFSPASEVSSRGHKVYHDLLGEVAAPQVPVAFPKASESSKLGHLHWYKISGRSIGIRCPTSGQAQKGDYEIQCIST